MTTIRSARVLPTSEEFVPVSRLILSLAAAASFALAPTLAQAQWWRSGPKDFEECADIAEKAKTKEEKTSALGECNAKFAGRRKPGGGYVYYDFLQDRSFDIAGPNPTPDEQKKIDQHYTAYLAKPRHTRIATAMAAEPPPTMTAVMRPTGSEVLDPWAN